MKAIARLSAAGLALLISLGASAPATGAALSPGSLDATFGTGGKVVTPIGSGPDYANAVAIQRDGKIVTAGYTSNGSNFDFAVVRYKTDGSLDPTFGTGGKVVTPIGSGADYANAVAIQSDGRIVVAGATHNGSNYDFALVRYNTSGSLDTAFGTGGKIVTPIGSGNDLAEAVAIQSNGEIVAAGYTSTGAANAFALARYGSDGSLDTTFGIGGKAVTPIGSFDDEANAIAIQSNGEIVAAGYTYNGSDNDFALARYHTDGSLDATFGAGGIVTTSIGSGNDVANAVAIESDGKIVAAGLTNNGSNYDFALARYSAGGSLDATFGTSGIVTTPIGSNGDVAKAVAIQDNSKIVAAGYTYNGSNYDFALARYNAGGSLDTTFGTGGIVTTSIGSGDDEVNAIAIDGNGEIVAAGYTYNGSNNDFTLARYWGDSYQPDALLKYSKDLGYLGSGTYDTNGAHQTRALKVLQGKKVLFDIKIENAGNQTVDFTLAGNRSSKGFKVIYVTGGNDVTSQVVAGTYDTGALVPSGSLILLMQVKVASAAKVGSVKPVLLTAASASAPKQKDAVKAVVKVK